MDNKKINIIMFILIVVSLILSGITLVTVKGIEIANKDKEETKSINEEILTNEIEILTSLSSHDNKDHLFYAKLTISVTDDKSMKLINEHPVIVKDICTKIIWPMSYEYLNNTDMIDIKELIIPALEERLGMEIYDVYFTNYTLR